MMRPVSGEVSSSSGDRSGPSQRGESSGVNCFAWIDRIAMSLRCGELLETSSATAAMGGPLVAVRLEVPDARSLIETKPLVLATNRPRGFLPRPGRVFGAQFCVCGPPRAPSGNAAKRFSTRGSPWRRSPVRSGPPLRTVREWRAKRRRSDGEKHAHARRVGQRKPRKEKLCYLAGGRRRVRGEREPEVVFLRVFATRLIEAWRPRLRRKSTTASWSCIRSSTPRVPAGSGGGG